MRYYTYWAKTCFSLKSSDGFFLPKSELNMVVVREPPLEAMAIGWHVLDR